MVSRREWLGASLGAGAALALTPELLRALHALQQPGGQQILRAIPSTGEKLPVVGLSFSNHPSCADKAALTQVLKAFADKGGKLYDAMHVNPASEQFHIDAANELGITSKLFWSTRGTPGNVQMQADLIKGHIDSLLTRTKLSKIDMVMLPATADAAALAALREEKKAGRVRYMAIQTIIAKNQAAQILNTMRNEPLDFIGVDYDLSNRSVEDEILPLAIEKKIGVIAFFPLGNNSGVSCNPGERNLFARVGSTPLPEWAAEFDAKTWSHFFLKYVISHPAITVARVGTTKPAHMVDNMGGGVGRLPNEATRKRMAALIDSMPPVKPLPQNPAMVPGLSLSAAILDRYVGEYKTASGTLFVFRREADRLLVKPGNSPEAPLNARSETRFQDPRGPFFDFQLDAQGKVTGAVLEQQGAQGPQKIPLERK